MKQDGTPLHIVVLAPHPDDELLGCGGMMVNAKARGHRVTVLYLSSGNYKPKVREAEARRVCKYLGLELPIFFRLGGGELFVRPESVARLTQTLLKIRPDILFACHGQDGDWEHQQSYRLVMESSWHYREHPQGRRHAFTTLLYEVHRPMENYSVVEDITAVMPIKLKALSLYRSQLQQSRPDKAIMGLNQYRGNLHEHVDFAEVFAIKRMESWW